MNKKSHTAYSRLIFISLIGFYFGYSAQVWSAGFGASTGSPMAIQENKIYSYKNLGLQLSKFDGLKIHSIHFVGHVRTRRQTLLWIMKTQEGEVFSAQILIRDLRFLENSGNLYKLDAHITTVKGVHPAEIDVEISMIDKWTLLPVFGAQGGGGAVAYGGGIYDTNLGGTFIQGMFLGYNYNGVFSYDLNLYQDYIWGHPIEGMIDWSNNVNPTVIHNIDGSSAGQFTWDRQQEEFLFSYHLSDTLKLGVVLDFFRDSMLSWSGVNAAVYSGDQYRVRPRLTLGIIDIRGELEKGATATFSVGMSNFFSSQIPHYQEWELDLKKSWIVGRGNISVFMSGAAMTFTPAPYEYQVGGYLNLRGYIDSRRIGPYLAHGNFEYRPTLIFHHFTSDLIQDVAVQACLFTDYGSAWGDSTLTGDPATQGFNPLWSMGAGIRLNFLKYAGAILRFDVARTISPDEGWGITFGTGQFF